MLGRLLACLLAVAITLPTFGARLDRVAMTIAAAQTDCDCPGAGANCTDVPGACGCDVGCLGRFPAMQPAAVPATPPTADIVDVSPVSASHGPIAPDAAIANLFRPPRLSILT